MLQCRLRIKLNQKVTKFDFCFDVDCSLKTAVASLKQQCQSLIQSKNLLVGDIFFKHRQRDSWKKCIPLTRLKYEDLLYYYSNNPNNAFELIAYLKATEPENQTESDESQRSQPHQDMVKRYLTIDYYGCIQMDDGTTHQLKEVELSFDKSKFEQVMEILGLHDVICQ